MVSNAGIHIILCVPVFSGSLLKCVDGLPMLASNNKFVPHRQ